MNLVILKGRLTKDPEIRYTQSGKPVATFGLATDKPYRQENQNGPTADFHNCVAWDKLAETIGNNLVKGREILLRGRLQTRQYEDRDGIKRYTTEVVLERMEFCGSKPQGQNPAGAPPAGEGFGGDISDEEIPF
ncbi:single-stranded DNA-binding protein [Selenomonas sp. AB3002]|uniref:single-stranded DNA-binding protein n=1 Tax=Selenomonas sp. AB3002 TaxID=1392502 RepID=UPI00049645E0